MEALLHYVWRHRLLPARPLATTRGEAVEVLSPGLPNTNAGPDFLGAKVRIGGTLWAGDIEIHTRSTNWRQHGHHTDAAYNGVVLHVVETADCEVEDSTGRRLPQVEIEVPGRVRANYDELMAADRFPPCYRMAAELDPILVRAWLTALQTERFQRKAADIMDRVGECRGSWEQAAFATLARAFGFGVNSAAFELWAKSLPLDAIAKHRDEPLHVEAVFLGMAGLLEPDAIGARHREAALADGYYKSLCREWAYARHVFGLVPIDYHQWRFLRLRPQNFPHTRIAQIAALHHSRAFSLRALAECPDAAAMRRLLAAPASDYWRTHYSFAPAAKEHAAMPSKATIELLLINAAIPLIYAYGAHTSREALCARAADMMEELRAEDNAITRQWADCGLKVATAADSQALVQLKREYCDRRDCLRCRFGYEYLKREKVYRL